MISIALIGCTADTDTPDESEDGAQGNDGEVSQEGGELNIAYGSQPATLDSHFTTADDVRDISQNIFEPLVTLGSNLEVQPMLAESYDESEDGKTITFHLREGIQFHNGKEMKAEDVVASLERWQKMSSQAQTYLAGAEFEAEDDYTVIANIVEPNTLVMFIFADMTQFAAIMPKEVIESEGSIGVEEFIGTGPYQLEEWKQDQYIHLSKFANYQSRSEPADGLAGEKKALVNDIFFHFVKDSSTRVAGIKSGEYDIAADIPPDSAATLDADKNVENAIYANSFPVLVFNKKSGVFSNQAARQAANAALNMEAVLKAAYGSEDYYVQDHSLVKQEQAGWYTDAGSTEYNTYDPELAKQLLDEAGYDGEEVVILTSREYDDYYNMSVVIQQQWEAVGMNVKLDVTDWGTVLERRQDENAHAAFFTKFALRPVPIQYLFLNPEWLGWTDSEELKVVMDEILYADSVEEAQQYSEKLHEIFWEYLPVIKPGNSAKITSLRNGIDGFDYIDGPILWNVSVAE